GPGWAAVPERHGVERRTSRRGGRSRGRVRARLRDPQRDGGRGVRRGGLGDGHGDAVVIRVAAFGDVHAGEDSVGRLRDGFAHVAERADVLLLAGDLTKCGTPEEARVLAGELRDVPVPKLAVLGNHDYHAGQEDKVTAVLEDSGIRVLEGGAEVVEAADGVRLGVAGIKGFGGGFAGACGSDFGEPEMKAFIRHTTSVAERLEGALDGLDGTVDFRVALMHYAPVEETLIGERLEIYPFLGSYLLAEAV